MIAITLPDGSKREFAQPVTVAEVAAAIGPGLAKSALAGKLDGKVVDLSQRIDAEREVWFRAGPLVAAMRASIAARSSGVKGRLYEKS